MATHNIDMTFSHHHHHHQQNLIETVWIAALRQVRAGSPEIVIMAREGQLLGQRGITVLAERFSMMIGARASVLHDPSMDAIRILPPPRVEFSPQQLELTERTTTIIADSSESGAAMQGDSESSASSPEDSVSLSPVRKPAAVARSKIAKDRSSKVPRPPNAFIIYRQHHHPMIKALNPGVHNNQISVIIGNKWKTEDEAVKDTFRARANEVKRTHNEQHPEYQYQPRKPSQKRKRVNRAKTRPAAGSHSHSPSAGSQSQSLSPSTSPQANAIDPALFPDSQHINTLPRLKPINEGRHLLHDFSIPDDATFEQMLREHNATAQSLTTGPQTCISPQVLLSGPSPSSAYSYNTALQSLDFAALDAEAAAIRSQLTAELNTPRHLTAPTLAPSPFMDPAITMQAPSANITTSYAANPTTANIDPELAYAQVWKDHAATEYLRMGELELDFGAQATVPVYADLFHGEDNNWELAPLFGSDELAGPLLDA